MSPQTRSSATPGSTPGSTPTTAPWPLLALAAWLLPGLGHVLAGDKKRGIVVGATLLTMFIAGLLIGGIDVVDRNRDRLWYAGQVLIGPIAIAVGELHVRLDPDPRNPAQQPVPPLPGGKPPPYQPSIGRPNELGTLYCALAGVLNLLAILDVIGYPEQRDQRAGASGGRSHSPHRPAGSNA